MSTPQNPFAQPDKGDRFTPRDHPEWLGRLFIIYPNSVAQYQGTDDNGQPTTYEGVESDVAIVDLINPETQQPTTLSNARIANKALVPQIKKHVGGGMVLGRLTQSPPQGRNSGAYFLAEYSDADVQMATQYINTHPRNAFTQPTAQQAPAAAPPQQQWGQQPAPQYDVWQHTQAAPAGPPQGQWQQPPAASAQAAPAPMPPVSPSAGPSYAPAGQSPTAPAAQGAPAALLDPQLVAFLQGKGVNPEGMTPEQATMIANTFAQQQAPPF